MSECGASKQDPLAVAVTLDGEIVRADGRCIGWVVSERGFGSRRQWVGIALYKPRDRTKPLRGQMDAAYALASLVLGPTVTQSPESSDE